MNGAIIRPHAITAGMVSALSPYGIDPEFPAAALADDQPKVIVQTMPHPAGDMLLIIDVDLGVDRPVSAIAVMFTNLSAAASWDAYATTSAAGRSNIATLPNQVFQMAFGQAPTTDEARRHGLWTGATILRRHFSIYVRDSAANVELVIRAGVLVIGERWVPEVNYELGSGRRLDDLSTMRQLPGGETLVERGATVPVWRATWSNITEAELRTLWRHLVAVGTGVPVLVVEDIDATEGLAEGMHYGLIEAIDWSERVQVNKQRIELRIREML